MHKFISNKFFYQTSVNINIIGGQVSLGIASVRAWSRVFLVSSRGIGFGSNDDGFSALGGDLVWWWEKVRDWWRKVGDGGLGDTVLVGDLALR